MTITNVYAVIPTADIDAATAWWATLLGRAPDRIPMPTDAEWFFASGGLQVVADAEHAGAGTITLGVDDVDAELRSIAERGVDVPQAETVPSGQFRIATLHDPDGNTIVFAQELR